MYKVGVSTFAVLSVTLLFLSFFGPLFDHHYAERSPLHDHVYLGDSEPEHVHPFETLHTHDAVSNEAAPHDHAGNPDVTVYLAPDDESGQRIGDIGFSPWSGLVAQVPPDPLRFSYLAVEKNPLARYISPPTHPPLA